ncbi:MAG: 50S ribosomal protein L6 [Erysipelotrichaceae bacterium]|nr:50S ribosomal protein L6 [Erysipelotrichaceae bacterium]
MSRIGNRIITIPAGVTIENNNNTVTVKGPKGTLTNTFNHHMVIKVEGEHMTVARPDDSITMKTIHGTTRALLHNMVVGVSEGFKKKLVIVGIGYRAAMRGENLVLNIGYSHEVVIEPDAGVKISTPSITEVVIEGADRQAVGQTAARIRAVRKPEPYKGKGIKYENEFILRKEGKRAGKK